MQSISKSDAQLRVDQIRCFEEELQNIQNDNVISLNDTQKQNILHYHKNILNTLTKTYDIDSSKEKKQLSLGMKIASFLAALGLAFSIFLLFYKFWAFLHVETQVGILISTPIVLLIATAFLSKLETTSYYAKITAMLSFSTFVLNLAMLGSIFNITPSPNAFFIWSVFALVLAYATDTRMLLGIAIIFFSMFLSAKFATWGGGYWINFGNHPENFIPLSFLLFYISTIKHNSFWGFEKVYRVFSMLLFFIPVLILSNWGAGSYLDFSRDAIEGSYQLIGFIFSALSIYVGIKKGMSELVTNGNIFFTIFLYTKFYDWFWEWMPKYVFFLLIGLSAVLILIVLKRYRERT